MTWRRRSRTPEANACEEALRFLPELQDSLGKKPTAQLEELVQAKLTREWEEMSKAMASSSDANVAAFVETYTAVSVKPAWLTLPCGSCAGQCGQVEAR